MPYFLVVKKREKLFVRSKDRNLFTSLFSRGFILFLYDNHTHVLKVGLIINMIFSRFMSDNKRMTFFLGDENSIENGL